MRKILTFVLWFYSYSFFAQCDSIVSSNVFVEENHICEGEFTTLIAEEALTYLWNTGDITQSIIVNE